MQRGGWRRFVLLLVLGCDSQGRGLSSIRVEPVVTLGAASGDGAIATTPVVGARHPGGFRVVIPAASAIGTLPIIFDSAGRYLGSLRGNDSPLGAFNGPMFSRLGPGDSIWVFDNSARVLVFGPERDYVRTFMLPEVVRDGMLLPDGRLIVTSDSGGVIQLVESTGKLVRTMGAQDSSGRLVNQGHSIVTAIGGTFWTTTVAGRWRLEHWDTAGALLGSVEPQATWFPAEPRDGLAAVVAGDRPPAPRIVAAWTDASNRLWSVGEVADQRWKPGVAVTDGDKYFDTIIEVRNLTAGTLIAMSRLDNHYSSLAEPGVLVHVIRTSAGWQRAELMRVVFDETSRP